MNDPVLPSPEDEPKRISDAEALFRESAKPRPKAKPKVRPIVDASTSGQYEVEVLPEKEADRPVANAFEDPWAVDHQEAPARPSQKSSRPKSDAKERQIDPSVAVEEPWSRGAEWGATIAGMAVEAVISLALIYFLLTMEAYGFAFLGLLLGSLGFVFLSYPILITLERPVRITPEQAAKDFYGALSHHRPHYVRMWLLLSTAGKVSSSYASFDGFRRYWEERLAKLRKGRTSFLTPLKFEVHDFKAEKSAGKTSIDAHFTVRIFIRGKHPEGAVENIRMESRFVKGPDRMWYLEKGTLK